MKRFPAAAALIAAGLALTTPAAAQSTGTARGKVVDEKGQAVVDAQVALEFMGGVTRKFQTKTNKKGEFTQVGLHPGMYKITVSKEGYQGTYVEGRIALGEPTVISEIKILPVSVAKAGGADAAKANEEIRAIVDRGEGLVKEGKYDEAIVAFQELLTKNIATPEDVHYRIGTLHAQKKDWAAAEAALLKTLEVKPGHAGAQAELANVYQLSGQPEKAQEMIAKATTGGGTDPNVFFSTGIVHINAGRMPEAGVAFKKVIELKPDMAEAYYYLGTALLNQGDTPGAIANLEKYLSLNPTNTQNVNTATGLLKALKPAK
ncbi:MAG TPA: tetratricopeptide repeat protein [Vicinamibacteria bacterium]|nr:tetratricopeptide repeat protein [Vicinamibacteria bacterium]